MPLPNEVPNEVPNVPSDTAETRVRRWLDGEAQSFVWNSSFGWRSPSEMRDDVRAVLGALDDRVQQLERRNAGLLACEADGAGGEGA